MDLYCMNCGRSCAEGEKFCLRCGTPVGQSPEEKKGSVCPECGAPRASGDKFCGICGTELQPADVSQSIADAPAEEAAGGEGKRKKQKIIAIAAVSVLVVSLIAGVIVFVLYNNHQNDLQKRYQDAVTALEDREYETALKLFEELEEYEDSAAQAENLRIKQQHYDEAHQALKDHEFDDARILFGQLGSYRDSKELADFEVDYQMALFVEECADNGSAEGLEWARYADDDVSTEWELRQQLYISAAEQFLQLGDYGDSAARAQNCSFSRGLLALDQEQWALVEDIISNELEEPAREELRLLYVDRCADQELLAAWAAALEARSVASNADNGMTNLEVLMVEMDQITSFLDLHYYDQELYRLFTEYMDGMHTQKGSVGSDGMIEDIPAWYSGAATRCFVITQLHESIGFLSDKPDLAKTFVGKGELRKAQASVFALIEEKVKGSLVMRNDDGTYSLTFHNSGAYDFTLITSITYYDENDETVFVSPEIRQHVRSGETIQITYEVPAEDVFWSSGTVNKDAAEFALNGNKL